MNWIYLVFCILYFVFWNWKSLCFCLLSWIFDFWNNLDFDFWFWFLILTLLTGWWIYFELFKLLIDYLNSLLASTIILDLFSRFYYFILSFYYSLVLTLLEEIYFMGDFLTRFHLENIRKHQQIHSENPSLATTVLQTLAIDLSCSQCYLLPLILTDDLLNFGLGIQKPFTLLLLLKLPNLMF